MMDSDSGQSDFGDAVPEEIRKAAKLVTLNLLPTLSRIKYTRVYNDFKKWCKSKKTSSFTEEIFLAYFDALSKTFTSSTLWSRYSMLRSTVQAYNNIDIGTYQKLLTFLKKLHVGYKAKKSKVFTASEVAKFCTEAPDDKYSATKAAFVIGISGACRREELTNLTIEDVEDHGTFLHIRVPKTKTKIERSFTVSGDFYTICQTYIKKRPVDSKSNRFFLGFRNGICLQQPMGINTIGGMPKQIAKYLNLPDVEEYTGHSFRRTSATLLVDSGADITELKRHGGWKSTTVAEGYIENSLANKRKIGQKITGSVMKDAAVETMQAEPEPKRLKTATNYVQKGASTSTTSNDLPSVTSMDCSDTSNDGLSQMQPKNKSNALNMSDLTKLDKSVTIQLNNCNVTFNMFSQNNN